MRSDNLRPAPAWITPQIVKRVLELAAAPIGADPVRVTAVPTRGVKPRLEIVAKPRQEEPNLPAMPLRPTEESEADVQAPPAASPARTPHQEWQARHNVERKQRRDELLEADRTAFQIAFDRGVAVVDLAKALNREAGTVLVHTKLAGFTFGKRPPLADALTLEKLLELADPSVPLPELRSVRLKRERLQREAGIRRDRRAAAHKDDPTYRALGARQNRVCEDEKGAARQAVRPAPSREPAPHSPARAQPNPDRVKLDREYHRRNVAVQRRNVAKAEAFIDAGKTIGKGTNVHVKIAVRAVEARRAEDARLACPIEAAKRVLQRRHAPVCSMAVHGGDPDLFQVGHRKDLSRDELLAMAERAAQ
jgi:hypothetical protein